MTSEPRHHKYGITVSERLAQFPHELPCDAVGMFQIVPVGRDGFNLSGIALADFIRRAIYGLLDAGALLVRGA